MKAQKTLRVVYGDPGKGHLQRTKTLTFCDAKVPSDPYGSLLLHEGDDVPVAGICARCRKAAKTKGAVG